MPETAQVEPEKREATSIKIKPELWKETKIAAIRHGMTASELVEEAIEKWIKEHRARNP